MYLEIPLIGSAKSLVSCLIATKKEEATKNRGNLECYVHRISMQASNPVWG